MTTCWRLDDGHQTIVLAVINDHLPQTVYWGPTLPDGEDLPTLADAHLIDLTGGMMDAIAPISVCPAVADTFHGHPGMELRIDGAPAYPEFKVVNVVHTPDDVMGHSIRFECRDTALNLNLVVGFSFTNLHGSGQVLTAETTLITHTDIDLFWLAAPVLPAPQLADTVHTFSGKWTKEFQLNDVTWAPGQHMREARLGRSGHEHPPVAIFPEVGTTNTRGASYAMHFGWSGGHKMLAEELPDGRRQVQWGKLPGSLHPTIGSDGRKFYTSGPVHATYHDQGLNGAATTFQRFFRDGLSRPVKTPRPVHYNCWEAIYFDHDLADLCAIA
ncbi:MAG: glycoside hydrolase family 36 N-terminal domain-containing protein, partial [Planktomarina sp.]